MSAAQLLGELRTLGVKIWPDAGALRFKAPASAMTPELTARLRTFKLELLAILAGGAAANDDSEPVPDLPMLAALAEFDALIKRLCDVRGFTDGVRRDMANERRRMSPDAVRHELPQMRERLGD